MPDEWSRLQTQLGTKIPLVTTAVEIGERDWQITAVQNQDALLDAAEDLEHFPYGFLLWESSVGLARYLAANPGLARGKRILELGTGAGVSGMVAQALGAAVIQTDHQPGALLLAQANARQNGVTGLTSFLADWRSWNHDDRYDILLGADILYERAMHFYLEHIFRHNLAANGFLLLSDPGRPQSLEFAARLEYAGWNIALETLPVALPEDNQESRPVEVAILKCSYPQIKQISQIKDTIDKMDKEA